MLITFFGVDDLFLLAGLGEGFLAVYFSTVACGGASWTARERPRFADIYLPIGFGA